VRSWEESAEKPEAIHSGAGAVGFAVAGVTVPLGGGNRQRGAKFLCGIRRVPPAPLPSHGGFHSGGFYR